MKALVIINLLALFWFLHLWRISPTFTEVDVCMNYTELDREGVINESALSKFHPSYGFQTNPRNSVPRFIAGPALRAEVRNAKLGLGASCANLVLAIAVLVRTRKTARKSTDMTKQDAARTLGA